MPHLHVSMPPVEKLADFLVLLLPIFLLTSPGAIQSGLASTAVLDADIRRCYGATDDAAPGHDCCMLESSDGNVCNANSSRGSVSYRIQVLAVVAGIRLSKVLTFSPSRARRNVSSWRTMLPFECLEAFFVFAGFLTASPPVGRHNLNLHTISRLTDSGILSTLYIRSTMGASISSSSQPQQEQQQQLQAEKDTSNKICIDCDKKTQKELPEPSTTETTLPSAAAPGQACAELYLAVTTCNLGNKGQITPCVKEWDAFRACHEANGRSGSSAKQ
jgi:hypothetical protein